MMVNILRRSIAGITGVTLMSVIAGAANMALLVSINHEARSEVVDARAVIQFAVVLVAMLGVGFASQCLLSMLGARMFGKLRAALVDSISHMDARKVEQLGRERIYTVLTRDVPAVHEFFSAFPGYVFNMTITVAGLVYLFVLSARLFLVVMVCMVIGVAVARWGVNRRAEARLAMKRAVEARLMASYSAVVDGNKELKLNEQRRQVLIDIDFERDAEAYRAATVSTDIAWTLSSTWSLAMLFTGVASVVFLGPVLGIPTGVALAAVLVLFYMIGPITILMNAARVVHAARLGSAGLAQFDALPFLCSPGESAEVSETFAELRADNLAFHYGERDDFKVGPFNVTVRRGEIVYFVGGNGSGKSTAAKMIMGLYTATEGRLMVNGRPVLNPKLHRQRFSAVFQDFHLFDRLMVKSDRGVDPALVIGMLKSLHLSGKVEVVNDRFSSIALSYGQRKRLALLLAFVEDSEIYVFDEWAADQDPEFRHYFYTEFLPMLSARGKAVIVITHDDRYFHLADKVVRFESGLISGGSADDVTTTFVQADGGIYER